MFDQAVDAGNSQLGIRLLQIAQGSWSAHDRLPSVRLDAEARLRSPTQCASVWAAPPSAGCKPVNG
jgi:hypothetical protein